MYTHDTKYIQHTVLAHEFIVSMSVSRHSPSGPEIPDFILSAILLLSADRVKPQLVMWDTCTWTLLYIPAGYSTGHTVSSTHALNGEVHAQSFRNELHGLILFLVLIFLVFNKDENKSFNRKKKGRGLWLLLLQVLPSIIPFDFPL